MDSGGFRRAVQWKVRLQETHQVLDRKRTILEDPTNQIIWELQKEFTESLCPPSLVLEPPSSRRITSKSLGFFATRQRSGTRPNFYPPFLVGLQSSFVPRTL